MLFYFYYKKSFDSFGLRYHSSSYKKKKPARKSTQMNNAIRDNSNYNNKKNILRHLVAESKAKRR